MAIFARRTLQRLVDENKSFLSLAQTERHVRALNHRKEPYAAIAHEWEIVVLNAFSKIGTVVHEPDKGVPRKIDVVFRPRSAPDTTLSADITTVGTQGRNEQNPIEYYERELNRLSAKFGLDPSKFDLHVEGRLHGAPGDQVMDLILPPQSDAHVVFDAEFRAFLKMCNAVSGITRSHFKKSAEADIRITYDPSKRYFTAGRPVFEIAYSLTQNPIYNALKSKANHLKEAQASRPSGVVLCASDLSLRPSSSSQGRAYDCPLIVDEFFRNHSSISFVLALEARDPEYRFGSPSKPILNAWLYRQPYYPHDLTQELIDCLAVLTERMPPSVNSGINALYELQDHKGNEGRSFAGGFTVSGDTMKISSRALGDILAGRISQEKIKVLHSAMGRPPNIFELFRRRGQTIASVSVERQDDADDDWITFTFSDEKDPAVSRFVTGPAQSPDFEPRQG